MFFNYLTIALRELRKQKGIAAVKILGLAIGFVCSILVLMHWRYTESFDRHFPGGENIYRLVMDFDYGGQHINAMTTSAAYEPQMRLEYPQIARSANARSYYGLFTRDGKSSYSSLVIADPEFADIFSLQYLAGDAGTALTEPGGIVLTETAAAKYFPDTDPIGRTLTLDEITDLKVTGVIRDLPANTHFDVKMLISVKTAQQFLGPYFMSDSDWSQFVGTVTYLSFDNAEDARSVSRDLSDFVAKYLPENSDRVTGMSNIKLSLEPLRDLHLSNRQVWGGFNPRTTVLGYNGTNRAQTLAGLAIFALLILGTSCVNFASLSLTQLQRRNREVGIRKSMGAGAVDISLQFLLETLCLCLLALLIALPAVYFAVPVYTGLTGTGFTIRSIFSNGLVPALVLLVFVTGAFSGLMPAIILSRHRPSMAVKGVDNAGMGNSFAMKAITVVQFTLSVTLVMFAVAVQFQIRHLTAAETGFNKNNIIFFDSTFNYDRPDLFDYEAMKDDFARQPGVIAVGGSNLPLPIVALERKWRLLNGGSGDFINIPHVVVDGGFIDVLQAPLLAGRNFSAESISGQVEPASDNAESGNYLNLLITRTTSRKLGFTTPGAALDQILQAESGDLFRIIGVIEDIHTAGGLENPNSSPGIFTTYREPKTYFVIRIDPRQTESALRHIDEVWSRYRPGIEINRVSYDRVYDNVIAEKTRSISMAASFASVITVLISMFGIQALAFHSGVKRTKEAGIRKVLGATSMSLVILFVWDLLKPVLVAGLIAWDPSGYMIDRYLRQFSSRADISPLIYLFLILAVLLVVVLTTALQALKTAQTNPATSLRYE